MSDIDKWFVLEEEDEKSFSTVYQSDVIYDETVKVGDSVSFFYNKKEFLGKVCMISDDHPQCVKEASRLNDLRKKESRQANGRGSFHAEPKKERKVAAKAKSTLTNIKSKLLKPSQAGKKARSKKMSNEQNNSAGQYAIVRFTSSDENSNSTNVIDLIPSSWIYEVDQKGYFTLYPDSTDYHHLDNWLLTLKSAEKHWDSSAITIIAYAKDLKQGKKRLKRALKSDSVKITNDEVCYTNEKSVMMLSKDSLEEQLNAVKPFLTNLLQQVLHHGLVNPKQRKNRTSSAENVFPSTSFTAVLPVINEDMTAEILNVQPISVDMKDHIDQKFQQLQNELTSQILCAKRSILYNLDKKITEVKHTIIVNYQPIATPQISIEKLKETLNIALPTVSLDHFLQLGNLLIESPEKKEALMSLFRVLITAESDVKESITKAMSLIMTNPVELQYTGTGRVINGHSKRNFSGTNSYICLRSKICFNREIWEQRGFEEVARSGGIMVITS